MPKKKLGMTPEQQSERFKQEAERLIDAGELSPTEADAVLDALVRKSAVRGGSER
jgi:polyhydroxyalkanoate synthesis regulator phasin